MKRDALKVDDTKKLKLITANCYKELYLHAFFMQYSFCDVFTNHLCQNTTLIRITFLSINDGYGTKAFPFLFDCVHVLSMFKLWSSKKRGGWRWNHDMGEEVYNLSHSPSQTKGWTKQFAAEKLNFENSFEVKKMNCVNRNLHCPQLCYNVNFLLSTKLDLKDTSKEKKSPSLTNNKPIID